MKKITLFILLVLYLSCKNNNENTNSVTKDKPKENYIYKSRDISPYLKFNTKFSEFEIKGLKEPQKFSTEELNATIKENEFEFIKSDAFKYYTVTTFEINAVTYKVIIYNSYGENDSKVLNIQFLSSVK